MKRIAAFLLCGALLAGFFCGCSDTGAYVPTGDGLSSDTPTVPSSPVTEQQLSLPYYPDRGLNPYQTADYVNRGIFSLIYQSLFAVDARYDVYPVLCQRFTVSKDMKTYVFYPAAATFPDGEPLTAADVEASLKTAISSEVYKGRFRYVKSVKLTEDEGIQVTLAIPCENLPLLLDVPILKQSQQTAERPLGTGPYLYERYNDTLRLRRRTDWWCAAALPVTAEHISLVEGESPAQLRDEFEFNDLGLVTSDPGSSSFVDFHSDYELWDSENGLFLYLGCNTKNEILSDQSIRSALTFAIDRDTIAEEFYHDFAYSAVLAASPKSPVHSQALAQKYGYAPEKLTQALTDAGLEAPTVKLLLNTDDSVRLRAGRAIARMLTAAGLKVITDERNGVSYRKALQQRNFDLYLGQTRLSANMDLSEFFDTAGVLNYGSMSNAALYGLCQESLANSGNFYTLHQKIAEDGRLTPILFRSNAIFAQRGAFTSLTPSRDNLFFYHLGRTLSDAKS